MPGSEERHVCDCMATANLDDKALTTTFMSSRLGWRTLLQMKRYREPCVTGHCGKLVVRILVRALASRGAISKVMATTCKLVLAMPLCLGLLPRTKDPTATKWGALRKGYSKGSGAPVKL